MIEKIIEKSSAVQISRLIRQGEMIVRDVVSYNLRQYEKYEKEIHGFLNFQPDDYLNDADRIQTQISKGEANGPLAGIPIAVKDNICTRGIKTTCGSEMLKGFIPPYSAHVVEALKAEGVVITGKCNMDEFAMGSTSETSAFGPVRNPWNIHHSPGGSSGGSAAAVSSGMAILSLGSDTGGSIRQPASYCGISGLKPTYGTVSRYGLIAYASSLDQIGPIAVHTEDLAALLDGIKTPDKRDSPCLVREPSHHLATLEQILRQLEGSSSPLRGKRIAVLSDSMNPSIQPEVRQAISNLIAKLSDLGAFCEMVSLPSMKYAVPAYYIIASAEASSNLSRYDGIKYTSRSEEAEDLAELYVKTRTENFGNEVIRRILLGSFVLSSGYFDAYYRTALKIRGLIKRDYDRILDSYDAILSPVSQGTAPVLGESLGDPLKMYMNDCFTVSANLTGLPALAFPCGLDHARLPVGAQLMGRAFNEDMLFLIAAVLQEHTDFHLKRPFDKGGVL